MHRSKPEIDEALALLYGDVPLVYGSGPVPCAVMMVGEAPGAREIESGTPFTGQAGGHLDTFLAELGLPRSAVYISNVCKFRPTRVRHGRRTTISNRTPTTAEVRTAVPFLLEEIACINPRIIITLGNTPLRAVLGDREISVGAVHGSSLSPDTEPLSGRLLFSLYHPASLIYNPSLKPVYADDVTMIFSLPARGLVSFKRISPPSREASAS